MKQVYAAVLVSQLIIVSMVALVAFVAGAAEQARQGQVPAPVEPSISRCSSASEWYRVSVSPGVIWAQCTCEEQVNS